jgi:2'-5' RNA ligase
MRLFIGINLPKKLRGRIDRAIRSLRDEGIPVRWIDPENYHITLKFLGEVRRERTPSIEEALAKVASTNRSFTAKLSGFGAFPTVRRPRVLWLGVEATPEFRCMKQDLEWAMGEVGFEPETRSFHPHVTLGRAGSSGGAGVFRGLDRHLAALEFEGEVRVHTLDLIRSQLSREGPRYTVRASSRLSSG